MAHAGQRQHGIAQPTSLQNGAVKNEPEPAVGLHWLPQREQLVIREVGDDLDRIRWKLVLLDQNVFLDRLMYGQDLVGKSRTELFLPEKDFEEEAVFAALEFGSEGVRHRIVDIQQDLCPHQFG